MVDYVNLGVARLHPAARMLGQLEVNSMKSIARILAGAATVAVLAWPAFSQNLVPLPVKPPVPVPLPIHPAPGPIAGASLPFLAVGYGVYWLVRRRRRKAE
jgi:hypothetical protein